MASLHLQEEHCEEVPVAKVVVLTNLVGTSPLPALGLLNHEVTHLSLDLASSVMASQPYLVLVDATLDLVSAHRVCSQLQRTPFDRPLLLIVNDSGLAAMSLSWGLTDFVMSSAGPSEIETRIRLALEPNETAQHKSQPIRAASLVIDEDSYSAKLAGRTLDLTFKEFELLKFLASHPSRVFTREQLLSEVWGYDYFGGTRTVDVHVRRLRAKLGESEHLIGTVRNVGYRFAANEQHADELLSVES